MELSDLFKQAKAMQERAADMQAQLGRIEVEGSAGGGLVRVTMSGKSEVKRVSIDPSLLKAEEREILEDLIVAAAADAKAKAERKMAEEMQKLAGSLGLPPGMNLPGL
jgi:DNA-binding YbaB/EbfC family protein